MVRKRAFSIPVPGLPDQLTRTPRQEIFFCFSGEGSSKIRRYPSLSMVLCRPAAIATQNSKETKISLPRGSLFTWAVSLFTKGKPVRSSSIATRVVLAFTCLRKGLS